MKTRIINAIIAAGELQGILYDEDALYLSTLKELRDMLCELESVNRSLG